MIERYTFDYPPTKEEVEKFEYFAYEYVTNNPGRIDGLFRSYVGVYFSETGEMSSIYVANSSLTQYE